MEIVYVYSKRRSEFGRQCNFLDRPPELHCDIPFDPEISANFIPKEPVEVGIQCSSHLAEHDCNTKMMDLENRGINHTEGGWPKDVNVSEIEQVLRFRRKIEKDEGYISSLMELSKQMENCIKQNSSLDIYEEYFSDISCPATAPVSSPVNILNIFQAPIECGQIPSSLSWYPDGPKKIAVAFTNSNFTEHNSLFGVVDSYIWDVENSIQPDFIIKPQSSLFCLEYNPKDSHTLIGGQKNGQIALFDTRKSCEPCELTNLESGHHDPVFKIIWISSKTGNECFSTSTDGKVIWWDARKLSDPIESMFLDPTKRQNPLTVEGGICLEYEATMPTKFMVGTEQGHVISCNRKSKSMHEKVSSVYSSHIGPIKAVHRNPVFLKNFLSIGDWTARIWAEDLKESPIWCSRYDKIYLTDGCWSPSRPGVFFTTKMNGMMDVWDITFKQNDPMFKIKISDEPVQRLQIHEAGKLLALASDNGMVTMLGLDECLYQADKNEKFIISSMLDRETRREKLLEAKHKEQKTREKVKSAQTARSAVSQQKEDGIGVISSRENETIARAEKTFLDLVEVERRKMLTPGSAEDDEKVEERKLTPINEQND